MKILPFLFSVVLLTSCYKSHIQHSTIDNTNNHISINEMPEFREFQKVYVPAYSNLYYLDGNSKLYYTVVLSLRNISFNDTLYFTSIDYYRDNGQLLRSYIDSPLMLKPMQSIEYIVEQEDKEGGAGANFVVTYGLQESMKNLPLIETVMSGTAGQYGFAFKSEGIPIIE